MCCCFRIGLENLALGDRASYVNTSSKRTEKIVGRQSLSLSGSFARVREIRRILIRAGICRASRGIYFLAAKARLIRTDYSRCSLLFTRLASRLAQKNTSLLDCAPKVQEDISSTAAVARLRKINCVYAALTRRDKTRLIARCTSQTWTLFYSPYRSAVLLIYTTQFELLCYRTLWIDNGNKMQPSGLHRTIAMLNAITTAITLKLKVCRRQNDKIIVLFDDFGPIGRSNVFHLIARRRSSIRYGRFLSRGVNAPA